MIENLVSSSADLEFDHPRCECGITGVVTPNGNAAEIAARLNYEQKNRGTQANGIGWFTSGLTINRKLYQNQPIEKNPDVIGIEASMALGHTRYTTEGDGSEENIQPAHATWEDVDGNTQELILSHNGNVNLASIQKLVKKKLPEGASDSVYIAQLIAESHGITMAEKLHNALLELEGSYSLTILSAEGVFGIRDPRGNRPLHFAQYEDGTSILASEDYPLQERSNTQDGYLISIPPGSLVHINPEGQTTIVPEFIEPLEPAFCSLDKVYLGRPENLKATRLRLGQKLAQEHPLLIGKSEAEKKKIAVVGIPRGGDPYAEGFAKQAGLENYGEEIEEERRLPLLEKTIDMRSFMAARGENANVAKRKMRLNQFTFARMILAGVNEIILVDDSLIRGSQIKPVLDLIHGIANKFGREIKIHVALGSPEVYQECGLGIALDYNGLFYNRLPQILGEFGVEDKDIPKDSEGQLALVLEKYGIESLYHLSKRGMLEAFNNIEIPDGMGNFAQVVCAYGHCLQCMQKDPTVKGPEDWYNKGNIKLK